MTRRSCGHRLNVALLAGGVALRLLQYLSNPSLTVDEAALARNLLDHGFTDLFRALDYAQVAPPAFLALEKGAITLFGPNEYGLRLIPFACGIAALLVFRRVCGALLMPAASALALSGFALGIPFIFWGAQLKPYSGDVLAALLIVDRGLAAVRHPDRPPWGLGIVAAAVAWLSSAAIFPLAAVTAWWVAVSGSRATARRCLPLAIATASALLALAVARASLTGADWLYMEHYWEKDFLPATFGPAPLLWFGRRVAALFGGPWNTLHGLGYPLPALFAAASMAGLFAMTRQSRPDTVVLLAGPFVLTVAASAVRAYPFGERPTLFLLPALLLLAAAGFEWLHRALAAVDQRLGAAALALVAAAPLLALARRAPPYDVEPVRPLFSQLAIRLQPGDRLFVHYSAGQQFLFYAPRLGIDGKRATIGRCQRDDPRGYLHQLDRLRASPRAWVVLAHALPSLHEREILFGYLARIGHEIEVLGDSRAEARLYDLADEGRLASAAAETFPLPPRTPTLERISCYGTMTPQPRELPQG